VSGHALVVGAGPAGIAAALRLAESCDVVTVAEARPRGRLRQAGEHLPPAGLRALAAAGLADLLDDPRHVECSGVRSSWGTSETEDREYFFALPGRGLNLDRRAFDAALTKRAERSGVRFLFDTRLAALDRSGAGYTAALSTPGGSRQVRAELVVDASGRRAAAAGMLGVRPRRLDRLVGIAGVIEGTAAGEDAGRLTIEAIEDAWWYAARLADGAFVATLMTDGPVVRAHPHGARELWRDRLASSPLTGALARLGRWPGQVRVFDASTQWLEPIAARGFIAVGDAAAGYDPLSSWGIAKGVSDGDAAATALARAAGGETDATAAHAGQRRASFERHCRIRHTVYAAEARWPRSPFWQARRDAEEHPLDAKGSEQ
jgi:flavin-dependent dehydrogenase